MKKRNIRLFLFILVTSGLVCSVATFLILWNRPLGPRLALPDAIKNLASDVSSAVSEEPDDSKALCNGPAVMTILLIGSDSRSNDYLYGLADSIRLVRVDFTQPGVMLLDIPRDLWVEIPGLSDHYGITHGKLNQAYFFGNPGMGYYDGPGEGPGLLAQTVDQNFGGQVDRYIAMNMTTFVNAIDSMGGIDVRLESTVNLNKPDAEQDPNLIWAPGDLHMDGNMALMMARNRSTSIFQRARYQDIVLSALRNKLLSPQILPKLPALINQFSGAVQTDLSPNEINQLVCIADKMEDGSTQIVSFPEELFSGQTVYDPYRKVETYTLAADYDLLRAYFADFMKGTWR